MPAPLLETKLYVPRPRDGAVPRPRLGERLDAGAATRLMLVSAPAGFGKTTLLAEWLAGRPSAAWVSLDRGDNDLVSFWTYVIAALRTVAPGVGAHELALLASPQPPPIHLVLTTLLNDLGATGDDLVLVLDDYHLVDSREIQEAMAFLLDRMPSRLHLVIASRADPPVPLARLRARGELVEIRAAELRFRPAEVAMYLTEVMGLRLTTQDVAALEERTEGWIAALQLAALSMQGRDDVAGFIAGFTGDDRYIVDYLAEEVLQRQAAPVRDFLLHTSLLGRLDGSLCDAVTGGSGGRATLEALDRGNLFVVPLDDRRQWYRYHHLFADVLRARLADEAPDLVATLHRRASDWFAEHGDPVAAIEHAMAGGHLERAADLVELAMPATRRNRQEAVLRSWLERLPEEVLAFRPVLSNGFAGALLATGGFSEVERHLVDAERWLAGPEDADRVVVVDEEELRRLPAGVAVHRAGLALVQGDPAATLAHARRALALLEDDHHIGRASATALVGLASWWTGDLESAREAYTRSLGSMQAAGHLADVLGLSIALADILITQGRLREAMLTYERALRLAPDHRAPLLRGTADMYVGMSTVHRERDDLGEARRLVDSSEELGEHLGLPQHPYRLRVAKSALRALDGNPVEALALLDEAERVYVGDFSPDVRPVPAVRARTLITQGRVDEALGWARDRGLPATGDVAYLHEFEHVTLARALLARFERDRDQPALDEATGLLDRLLAGAETGQRTGTVIEVLVLQALAARLRGDLPAALVPLGRALALAEPEGYVRTFVDEGPAMAALLAAAARHGLAPAYVARLRSAAGTRTDAVPVARPGLVDPLSRRELDVLRLLGTDLGGPEIARELVVSLNTVRTHTKNIYAKLGVNNRRAAVRRAEELDLMPRAGDRAR
ncbi:LuxR C-terminal-related transcriptional regulator [Nocardioides panacis]|uniref:LuxR C-terminal-related transcriptional regulator n=1 Tax=Nocardioides panacis TaxID=2849501 RepID=UPI0020B1BBD2|nr:LuxR C-terminal-related transcriptional regulator [Nocardioides panacis]